MNRSLMTALTLGAAVLATTLSPSTALAHGNAHPTGAAVKKEQKPWGIAGDRRAVRRTLTIRMDDQMRFIPEHFEVREGDTLRLILPNDGVNKHEFVLGTREELAAHAELMKKFPDMEHDEPYMAHVAPGEQGEIVWNFNRPGEFQFACLISDHYEQGMVGSLKVLPRTAKTRVVRPAP